MIAHDKTDLGGLYCYQAEEGPRFSLDALALAHRAVEAQHVLELGCASGVISFLYQKRFPKAKVVGVDLFPELIALANKAKEEQNLDQVRFEVADVCHFPKHLRQFDLVLSNPPYFRKGEGKKAKSHRLACARSEEAATLHDFLKAGATALKDLGRLMVVLPPQRLSDAICEGKSLGLHAEALTPIASYANQEAVLFLLRFQKSGKKPLALHPPLIFYKEPGVYTAEVGSWYKGEKDA